MSTCTGCRVCRTRCASGRPARSTAKRPVSVGEAIYSVPHQLIGERVWVRAEGEQLVVVHIDPDQGPREVARHPLTTPGRPSINDEHYPPRPAGALERARGLAAARSGSSLQIGDGAERWLKRAAAEGTSADPAQDGRGGRPRKAARHRAGQRRVGAVRELRPVRRR